MRGSLITNQSIKSCGNCGMFIKGIRVSYPQLELHKLLGRGVINFKTRCGLRPDIAFVQNGRKIAIEYDEEVWHNEKTDLEKTKRLMKDGWKVIRVLVNDKFPDKKMLCDVTKAMNTDCDYTRFINIY